MNNSGEINANRQELLRRTEVRGTDANSWGWIVKCRNCGHIYGCNSTDFWERKCPTCQKGRPGLEVPTERDGKNWTHEELVIAFHLYNQIPFGTIHARNPMVRELAAILGRKVGSASYKLSNFARLDPSLQARGIRGFEHGSRMEEQVWREFADRPEALAFESARFLAQLLERPIEQVAEIDESDLPPPGVERDALVRLRVNQSFFRKRVLSAYEFRCCVTGLAVPELLVASHIVPWAEDPANRLNPRNGLCLNPLHDRAFDRYLMWVDERYVVRLSPALRGEAAPSSAALDWLLSFEGKPLLLPEMFRPDAGLLLLHARKCHMR